MIRLVRFYHLINILDEVKILISVFNKALQLTFLRFRGFLGQRVNREPLVAEVARDTDEKLRLGHVLKDAVTVVQL